MPYKVTSDVLECVIVFADIIDSSKYSSVLGTRSYCNDVLKFQQLFRTLASTYFLPSSDDHYSFPRVYGDEGVIFHIAPLARPDDLVYKAVQFAYELKARMELQFFSVDKGDSVPQKMDVGVGIHYAEVALVVENGGVLTVGIPERLSDVKRVEGYTGSAVKEQPFSDTCLSQEIRTRHRKGLWRKNAVPKRSGRVV